MDFLITAGPTREHIDDVRFLSNPASGRLGIFIAEGANDRGHDVELVLGPTHLSPDEEIKVHPVETAEEMRSEVMARFESCDVLVMSAAVGDVRPAKRFKGKYKKEDMPKHLELERTSDILKEAGQNKSSQYVVGFAVETEADLSRAKGKLKRKNVDLLGVNRAEAMGAREQKLTLLAPDEAPVEWPTLPKPDIAQRLLDHIERQLQIPE